MSVCTTSSNKIIKQDMIDFYVNQSEKCSCSVERHKQLRMQGLDLLQQVGFPVRSVEAWKYSSVDSFLAQTFYWSPLSAEQQSLDAPIVPQGVTLVPLIPSLKMAEGSEPYLGNLLQVTHAFHALNNLFLQQGWFIYVPENCVLDEPIRLNYAANKAQSASILRHVVVAGPGSRFSIIESYDGSSNTVTEPYFTNTITELYLDKSAQVAHYKLQNEGKKAFHFGELVVSQSENSQLESHVMQLGGQWVRSDVNVYLKEAGARCLLNGIYLLDNQQHVDQQIAVHHQSPGCVSVQDYKGLLQDQATAVFNGQIMVDAGAVKTEARQQNKNLLLSSTAQVNTKPQLNIYADDVLCSHGATVGQLDEDALFYLATRGIDASTAKQYLIKAFLAENIQRIHDKCLLQAIYSRLGQKPDEGSN